MMVKKGPNNGAEGTPRTSLTRRHWLALATTTISGTIAATGFGVRHAINTHRAEQQRLYPAQNFFDTFPEEIPGAKTQDGINKCPNPEAAHCLVHIRDTHGMGWLIDNHIENTVLNGKEGVIRQQIYQLLEGVSIDDMQLLELSAAERMLFQEMTEKLQPLIEMKKTIAEEDPLEDRNIARIVEYIVEKTGVRDIAFENANNDTANFLENYPSYLKQTDKEVTRLELLMAIHAKRGDKQMVQRLLQKMNNLYLLHTTSSMRVKRTLDEIHPLYATGEIVIHPSYTGDDEEVRSINERILFGGEVSEQEKNRVAIKKRERVVLETCQTRPVTLLRYGGSHQFWESIESWNAQHPKHQYSLIEVTPKGYVGESK